MGGSLRGRVDPVDKDGVAVEAVEDVPVVVDVIAEAVEDVLVAVDVIAESASDSFRLLAFCDPYLTTTKSSMFLIFGSAGVSAYTGYAGPNPPPGPESDLGPPGAGAPPGKGDPAAHGSNAGELPAAEIHGWVSGLGAATAGWLATAGQSPCAQLQSA